MKYDQNRYTKLNLGCGQNEKNKFPDPWLNVDGCGDVADCICDVSRLPMVWSNSFYEVRASHVLEHLFLKQMKEAVHGWTRVLRVGGLLRVIVPDLDVVVSRLISGFDGKMRASTSVDNTTAVLAQIYGVGYDDPKTESYWRHRFLFNRDMLMSLLVNDVSLSNVTCYSKTDDPAGLLGINDDSQNEFSLCVMATKT